MRYFIFLYNCHHLRSYNDRLQGTFTCMSSDFLLWFSLWENKVNLTHLFIIIQRKRQLIMTWTRLWKRSLPKAVSFGAVYRCSLLFHGRIPSHSEILHVNFDRNINNFFHVITHLYRNMDLMKSYLKSRGSVLSNMMNEIQSKIQSSWIRNKSELITVGENIQWLFLSREGMTQYPEIN